MCSGLCEWNFKGVPMYLESTSQWDMQTLTFQGWFLFIPNSGAWQQGPMLMPKGKKPYFL